MAKKDFEKLYNDFIKIMQEGTEEEAKKFLTDHYKEFPKEIQDKIALLFFEEALDKMANSDDQVIADIQEEGLAAAKKLEDMKKTLEDKKKELEIKESV